MPRQVFLSLSRFLVFLSFYIFTTWIIFWPHICIFNSNNIFANWRILFIVPRKVQLFLSLPLSGLPLDPVRQWWPDNTPVELAVTSVRHHPDRPQSLRHVRQVPPSPRPHRVCLTRLLRQSLGHLRWVRGISLWSVTSPMSRGHLTLVWDTSGKSGTY